jgi:hypothetical protein
MVLMDDDGDFAIGFAGKSSWHTHGDVLVGEYQLQGIDGLTPESATERFVESIVNSQALIAVSTISGQSNGIWVTDDPMKDLLYKPDNEEILFRYWDGNTWKPS